MQKVKVSIIIVFYENPNQLLTCLTSIRRSSPKISHEVIVVDNSKASKSMYPILKRQFPNVSYIKSPRNLGYGGGNNLGAKKAKGEYLFILNPATELKRGAISALV